MMCVVSFALLCGLLGALSGAAWLGFLVWCNCKASSSSECADE